MVSPVQKVKHKTKQIQDLLKFCRHCRCPLPAQLGQISKSRQKLNAKEFGKLTNHTYAYNSLTNFDNKKRAITGNGNAKSCFELIREINTCKLKKKIYFWRSFAIWNYCAPPHTWYSMIYSIHNLKYLWFLSDFHSWLCNGLLCLAKWTVFPPLNQFIYPYFLVVALYTIRSNYKTKGIK